MMRALVLTLALEASAFAAPPDIHTAGAAQCRLEPSVDLGPGHAPVVGFGAHGGLALWRIDDGSLGVRDLTADGQLGPGSDGSMPVNALSDPYAILPVDAGFVVVLREWDWQHESSAWGIFLMLASGALASPRSGLPLANMQIDDTRIVDGTHLAIAASSAAFVAPAKRMPPRVLAIEITANRANRVAVHKATTPFPPAPPPVAGTIHAAVISNVTPPPPGPHGTIYEASPEPELARALDGKPLGRSVALEEHGLPVGVTGIAMATTLVWSGSRFIYPFAANGHAKLLPIDCR